MHPLFIIHVYSPSHAKVCHRKCHTCLWIGSTIDLSFLWCKLNEVPLNINRGKTLNLKSINVIIVQTHSNKYFLLSARFVTFNIIEYPLRQNQIMKNSINNFIYFIYFSEYIILRFMVSLYCGVSLKNWIYNLHLLISFSKY